MTIILQKPYSNDWSRGYLVTNSDNRKTVILYNSHDKRSSTSYARYLMSVSLGRYLTRQEHVDHIDNDKTNDCLSNLQILTQAENSKKASKGVSYVYLTCDYCRQVLIKKKDNCTIPEKHFAAPVVVPLNFNTPLKDKITMLFNRLLCVVTFTAGVAGFIDIWNMPGAQLALSWACGISIGCGATLFLHSFKKG